jgi:hypothetical protein
MRAGDGNEADKAVFGKILVEFKKQINMEAIAKGKVIKRRLVYSNKS